MIYSFYLAGCTLFKFLCFLTLLCDFYNFLLLKWDLHCSEAILYIRILQTLINICSSRTLELDNMPFNFRKINLSLN